MNSRSTQSFYTPAPPPSYDTKVNCVFEIEKCYIERGFQNSETAIHVSSNVTFLFKVRYGQLEALQPLTYPTPHVCTCPPVFLWQQDKTATIQPTEIDIIERNGPVTRVRFPV